MRRREIDLVPEDAVSDSRVDPDEHHCCSCADYHAAGSLDASRDAPDGE